jgi:hypothetical protein
MMDLPKESSDRPRPLQRRVVQVSQVVAVVVGLKYGYDFGRQISGTLLGIVLAINGAVFCAITVGMIADRAFGQRQGNRDEP